MATFDPDKYLEESKAFDPDEYLGEAKPAVTEEAPGELGSAARGLASGVTFGAAPYVAAGVESVAGSLGLTEDKTYEQSLAESQANFKQAEEANPKSFAAGQLAGGVASSIGAAGLVKSAAPVVAKGAMSLMERLGPQVKSIASKTGAVGEKLAEKVAEKTPFSADQLLDIATVAAEQAGAGGAATAARMLLGARRKLGKVVDTPSPKIPEVKESAIVENVYKSMTGKNWDFPTKK